MNGIEGLGGGTAFADVFIGDDGANVLTAGQGDTLLGYGSDDVLQIAGIVGSRIDGGDGRDALSFSSGNVRSVAAAQFIFTDVNRGVSVDLARRGREQLRRLAPGALVRNGTDQAVGVERCDIGDARRSRRSTRRRGRAKAFPPSTRSRASWSSSRRRWRRPNRTGRETLFHALETGLAR